MESRPFVTLLRRAGIASPLFACANKLRGLAKAENKLWIYLAEMVSW